MRVTITARTLALALGLAATAAAVPAAHAGAQAARTAFAATTPASTVDMTAMAPWAGVYRISLARGTEVVPARVMVERVGPRLDGTVLVGSEATSLANMRGDGAELRAEMLTSRGRGQLVLRVTPAGLVGTLTVGKSVWEVSGERSA